MNTAALQHAAARLELEADVHSGRGAVDGNLALAKRNREVAAELRRLAVELEVWVAVTPLAGKWDLEVLDAEPRWELLPGQRIFVANVNGGDSLEVTRELANKNRGRA